MRTSCSVTPDTWSILVVFDSKDDGRGCDQRWIIPARRPRAGSSAATGGPSAVGQLRAFEEFPVTPEARTRFPAWFAVRSRQVDFTKSL